MKTKKGIATQLRKLAEGWNPKYTIWAAASTLCLVEAETGLIIESFYGIDVDGGDPDIDMDEAGNEYIMP